MRGGIAAVLRRVVVRRPEEIAAKGFGRVKRNRLSSAMCAKDLRLLCVVFRDTRCVMGCP